jgi:hypothetical protein
MTLPTTLADFKNQYLTYAKSKLFGTELSTANTETLALQGMMYNQVNKVDLEYPLFTPTDFISSLRSPYVTGGAVFLKQNAWSDVKSLSSEAKTALKNLITVETTALSDSPVVSTSNSIIIDTLSPPAVVGSVRCLTFSDISLTPRVLKIKSGDTKLISTGQTTALVSSNGNRAVVTSDGVKFWQWVVASATAFSAYSSTDGDTWASETLTGLPTFSALDSAKCFYGTTSTNFSDGSINLQVGSENTLIALHCGARHLLIGTGASNLIAATSTNGTSWTDAAATVLGSTTIPNSATIINWVYKNGNNVLILLDGGIGRFSSNGGVNWSGVTVPDIATNTKVRVSSSDPAYIAMWGTSGGTNIYVSTDSGATWTTRAVATNPATLYIMSSIIVTSVNGIIAKSTDNGATWANVLLPESATYSTNNKVICDDFRWYLLTPNQIYTSTNLSTWTLRTSTNNFGAANLAASAIAKIISFDVNTVFIFTDSNVVFRSLDGGVTWDAVGVVAATTKKTYSIIKNTTGEDSVIAGSYYANGGAYVKKSELVGDIGYAYIAAIAASRTPGLTAFVRVA